MAQIVSPKLEECPLPDDDPKKTDPPAGEGASAPNDSPAAQAGIPPANEPFGPEAVAARVDTFAEESDIDRMAREEEKKLHERNRTKGKQGLQAAASRRLARIGEVKVKRPSAASDAFSAEADPLLERTARVTAWIREHRQTFGGIVAVALLGLGGFLGYSYWQGKHEADASAILGQAFADEHGRVSDKSDDDEDDAKIRPLYPTFKSVAGRRDAAIARYREVQTKFAGTGAAILAHLAEAGLLLDGGDAKGAAAAYSDVKASPLARADAEVRGRAIEGIGFADELLAQSDPGNKDGHLDDALTAFKQLEEVDMKGFKELGQYHQARVLQARGDRARAIELLKQVEKGVSEPGSEHPFSYLQDVVEDRLRALDPGALPPKAAKTPGPGAGKGPGGLDMNDPKVQELLRQLRQQHSQGGSAPPGPPPGGPK
jgi:hypothetical protein